MRFIQKQNTTPPDFSAFVDGVAGYNALYNDQKQSLLKLLINEQHGLCAYCNQRITSNTATIEHLICQSHNPTYELKYFNLFAVCRGNEGQIQTSHCDKYRANGSSNDYFVPYILFERCLTTAWNNLNPFFDVEYNPRTELYSGKLIPRNVNLSGYPRNQQRVQDAIQVLNLNAEILINARKEKWESVKVTKDELGLSWQELFDHYLNLNPLTDFSEFVLLAIRKQVP
jgi:uncharacterized protein (TIGR02646 family)